MNTFDLNYLKVKIDFAEGCLYTADRYAEQFGIEYTGSGPSPWVEKDGEQGFTSESEEVQVGDLIEAGVVVNSNCAQA